MLAHEPGLLAPAAHILDHEGLARDERERAGIAQHLPPALTQRKRAMIRRSEAAKAKLTFIIEALKTLVDDDGLFALLEEEQLSTLPGNLAKRMSETREEVA